MVPTIVLNLSTVEPGPSPADACAISTTANATTTAPGIQNFLISVFLPMSGRVCGFCQSRDDCDEFRRLPDEQSVGGQGVDRAHGGAFGLGGPDDRDDRKLAIEEVRRLGHDQVGLCGLTVGV